MPLSDHEQRILDEIERNLLQEDPSFARTRSRGTTGDRDERKRAKLGALCFFAGLVSLLLFFYSQIIIVGVLAFAGMVFGVVLVAGAMRTLGSPGALLRSPADRVNRAVSEWEERVRQRYKKDE